MKLRIAGIVVGLGGLSLLVSPPASLANSGSGNNAAKRPALVRVVPAYDHDLPTVGKDGLEVTVPAPTARASDGATVAPAYSYVCRIYVADPYFEYFTYVTGWGRQSCSGSDWPPQNVQITIQTEAWAGYWNNRQQGQSGYTYNAYDENSQSYDCRGTGTYTYRVVIDAFVRGGQYKRSAQSTNYYVVTC